MSYPRTPCTGSSDITTLSYSMLYDISGATPTIILTNRSTVVSPANLVWWYVITTPSGTPIHTGSASLLDANHVAWTTLQITPGEWPLLFGTAPCAQVEFSPNAPYTCTLYVKDSSNNIFSLTILQAITRPNGNTSNSCGNFGKATVVVQTKCNDQVVFCSDSTNIAYQSILSASTQSDNWTLVYPPDVVGNDPANGTATNTPYVNFPITYSGDGYVVFRNNFCTYDMGNGAFIKVQYKAINPNSGAPGIPFAVLCNINLCKLQCQIQAFVAAATRTCGNVVDANLQNKISQMNLLLSQAIIGIMQPLCGIDVPAIIEQIKTIGNLSDDCDCGCTDTGIDFTYPLNPGGSSGSCCPVSSNVFNLGTTSPPIQCPDSYFPVQVFNPAGTSIIGIAYDANNLVALLNADAEWSALGVAFNEGNCKVGWYPIAAGNTIPDVFVRSTGGGSGSGCVGGVQNYVVTMQDICYPSTPIIPSSFPCNVFVDFGLGAGPVFVGNVASQAAMITALNVVSSKPVSLTFSAGATVDQVQVYNSNCNAYSGTITLTCDVGSNSFLFYGSSHVIELTSPPINARVEGVGMKTNSLLGKISGTPTSTSPWHTVKMGNIMMTAEGDTGKVYFFDITNPLFPVLARTIQLNKVVAACFSGTPSSLGLGTSVVRSIYSLYFVTDYGSNDLNNIYIFEGLTGSAWKLNFYGSGTGITASFQNAALIGKCPRVQIGNQIYFTQDGTLETDISGASGVSIGYITVLDLASFNASGLSTTTQILLNMVEYVWAATYDGANTIWFIGQKGTIAEYNLTTATVLNRYADGLGTYSGSTRMLYRRGNAKYFAGRLFIASLGPYSPVGFGQGCLFVDVATLPTSPNATLFTGNLTNPSANAHNILPLGNCIVAVTVEDNGLSPTEGSILFYKTNGTFLGIIRLNTSMAIYNLVPIPNINTYTPNNLV